MVVMQKMKVGDVLKLKGNPRKITQEEMECLKESLISIPEYMEAHPIVLSDRTGEWVVIDGNQRLEAARQLGWKEVPTAKMSGLSKEKEREIIIRANVNNGKWDYELLKTEWDLKQVETWGVEMPECEEDFDLISMDDLNLDKKGIQNTDFSITFTFSNELKDSFELYFKDNGKESITQLIIDTICQDAEAK